MDRRHALARLIDEVKTAQSLSDEDIARAARRAGYQISKQHVAHLRAQDPLKSIVPDTIKALAAGMEVPVRRVLDAAIPSAGLPAAAPEDWSVETAIDHDPELTLQAKRMLHGILAAARGERNAATGRGKTAPSKTRPVAVPPLDMPAAVGSRAARRRGHVNEEGAETS